MQYSQLRLQTTPGFARLHLCIISVTEVICCCQDPYLDLFSKEMKGNLIFKPFYVTIFSLLNILGNEERYL